MFSPYKIRNRVLAGLIVMIVLLMILGSFGVSFLRQHAQRTDQILAKDYDAIRAANDLRLYIVTLNANYLPTLVETDGLNPGPQLFEDYRKRIDTAFSILERNGLRPAEREVVQRLDTSLQTYLTEYEEVLDAESDLSARKEYHDRILALTQQVASESEQAVSLFEQTMLTERNLAVRHARESVRLMIVVVTAACMVAILIYFQFGRSIVGPVSKLTESIRQVRERKFELAIPVEKSDELGELTVAFNDMAAEMRELLHANDQIVIRANLESRAILATFPHPIIILNRDGEISQVNSVAEELIEKLATPGRLPKKIRALVDRVLESNEDYLPEDLNDAILKRVGEKEYYYLPGIFQIEDETGIPAGWAVVLNDVTRFRWMDDLKTDMIATVSHEIKTPLTSIRMALHLLRSKKLGPMTDRQQQMVDTSCEDCERLLQTLEHHLQMARWESGAKQLETVPVTPQSLIDGAVEHFSALAEEQDIILSTEIADDLPRVFADRGRAMQVLDNLISNAVKYGPEKGRIRLRASKNGSEFVRFSVLDDGPGVPYELQDRVFDKFYRLPNQKSDGVGLGLSICREIIYAHGGRIGVNSSPGQSTEFYFSLPLAT